MVHPPRRLGPVLALTFALDPLAPAQEPPAYRPHLEPASREAEEALAGFAVAQGFAVRLFAAEPLLANPVCFAVDGRLRFYVAETFRLHAGVTDMREHMDWLDEELACRTVADRVAMMRARAGADFEARYAAEHERVRRIEDTDGDGRADRSTVFADGFQSPASGIAAGLLPVGEQVYYACIPDLWLLTDADDDGVAEGRRTLSSGWGVHIALLGHDMHGLCRGPDGRLYWSIGDRGFHVEQEGRVLAHPHTGAVLRSELDGSGLEIFATGLRNPQELVFDDHGNLFTGDNNSDGGDRARWVYLIEGAEIGWRHAFQYVTRPNLRGPWNAERLWEPAHPGQPAYTVPPVANFTDGPSGLCHYPGSGWGPDWRGHFFLCDFRGAASISGVHTFRNRPLGAGFQLVDASRFLWNCLATDVDFAADGNLYVSDWVSGWGMTGKGRLYRVEPRSEEFADERAEIQRLLSQGMTERDPRELGEFLAHPHQRVRLEAQWELAARARRGRGGAWRGAGRPLLDAATHRGAPTLPRLHGLWGLGQVIRARADLAPYLVEDLLSLHRDPDDELRAQVLKVLGEAPWEPALPLALRGLVDPSPRVRFFAAEALGKLGRREAIGPLFELLAREGDSDPWLRHGAVWALVRLGEGDGAAIAARGTDPRPAVRRGALVALRRLARGEVAAFLADDDPTIVAEAARAIHDVPIPAATGELARLLEALPSPDPYLARRALNANRTLGGAPAARRIARWLAGGVPGGPLAREGLEILTEWCAPSPRDRILGEWRPLGRRPGAELDAVGSILAEGGLPEEWGEEEHLAWIELVEHLGAPGPAALDSVARLATDLGGSPVVRRRALQGMVALAHPLAAVSLEAALLDPAGRVRTLAYEHLADVDPDRAVTLLARVIASEDGDGDRGLAVADRQQALRALARIDSPAVEPVLVAAIEGAAAGQTPSPLTLELLEAAEGRPGEGIARALAELVRGSAEREGELGPFAFALAGGDALAGRRVFLEKTETGCLRCHALGGRGGSEVGPDLTEVGARLARREILTAIVDPDASVAPEYENWIFALSDGTLVVGRIRERGAGSLRIETPRKELVDLALDEIVERRRDVSSMPADLHSHLSSRELRDLLEFLALQTGSRQTGSRQTGSQPGQPATGR